MTKRWSGVARAGESEREARARPERLRSADGRRRERGGLASRKALEEAVGRRLLGPILLECCARLHDEAVLYSADGERTLLFCARGGLRMQLAYEAYLGASGRVPAMPMAPFMVSRLVVLRAALARLLRTEDRLARVEVERVLKRDFGGLALGETLRAIVPKEVDSPSFSDSAPTTGAGVVEVLSSLRGADLAAAVLEQSDLFDRHLNETLGDRTKPVLVDTGRFGTTGALLTAARPDLTISSLLLARALETAEVRPGDPRGLSVEARYYAAWRPSSVALRHWHFFEQVLEPPLPSVSHFDVFDGKVVSDLDAAGWQESVPSPLGTMFYGALAHVREEGARPRTWIDAQARRAWRSVRRALVYPTALDARLFGVLDHSFDFGREDSWGPRPWRGPVRALQGPTLWREGEIAEAGTLLRLPLLFGIEFAYNLRALLKALHHR